MALDFPNAPITGATFPGLNGALWQWDGEKWTAVSTSSTGGGGGASIVMQPSPPALAANALWWDTIGGQLYVCYDDGVGPLQWVTAANIPGPPASQVTQVDVASAQRNVGRNLIHNPLMAVAQRGAGPFTIAAAYTADRWLAQFVLDTVQHSIVALGDAGRAAIGDENARFGLQCVFVGNAGPTAYSNITQPIENVTRLAGKTVIVSFWATSTTSTKLGVNAYQSFGTGGSPSASVGVLGTGISVQLAATWARYSVVMVIPSIAGKTLGTNGNDCTVLQLFYSSGANNNITTGNIGQQSATTIIWGVQLEIAAPGQTAPSPLEKMDAQQTLAVCQRFYSIGYVQFTSYQSAGAGYAVTAAFPVTMRAAPATVTFSATSLINLPSISLLSANTYAAYIQGIATATATTSIATTFTASADL